MKHSIVVSLRQKYDQGMKGPSTKRSFRPEREADDAARYPDLKTGRRDFLRQLGIAAGGVLSLTLLGCDKEHLAGKVDSSGALVDMKPDSPPDTQRPDTSIGLPDVPDIDRDLLLMDGPKDAGAEPPPQALDGLPSIDMGQHDLTTTVDMVGKRDLHGRRP